MCIVLLTTSHPKYALIVLDNRDEFILRPTSRPHWWTAQIEPSSASGTNGSREISSVDVLSSRDLQRAERGTWLGVTKNGKFAVLTNYRETDTHDTMHPIHGKRSRGGMVTAWLGADPAESSHDFVRKMLESGDVKGVGGFSLICGKLRKANLEGEKGLEPLAILSNRCDHIDHIPWIGGQRNSEYGLSNAIYQDEKVEQDLIWPKVRRGTELLSQVIADKASEGKEEDELVEDLFKILDEDRFPQNHILDLEEGIPLLKHSIFIPAFGGQQHQDEMAAARQRGIIEQAGHGYATETLANVARPDDQQNGFQTGLYGTQRQTVILVDWEGNVTYRERALWDSNGNEIPRGSGDATFRFKIDDWDSELSNDAEQSVSS
ncbi:NRDE protein-domain-containing protein [Lasiosphaeria miniovina]|uniref:NRDE protein-domain-containing protein n=1 Tax=Lasiosphaeria miniovina TaxID=1954250 RepID=A0AA40A601_9PEZI|nr:NRDE protein-domain-containing protein [Lasiosphaeria miniovina]KAK0709904.1 NRDE protein-domain-containing protein [Lasiosphaeria miniovina]